MGLTDAMKKVNDILTAFAKGVLYRESGVLNSYRHHEVDSTESTV